MIMLSYMCDSCQKVELGPAHRGRPDGWSALVWKEGLVTEPGFQRPLDRHFCPDAGCREVARKERLGEE